MSGFGASEVATQLQTGKSKKKGPENFRARARPLQIEKNRVIPARSRAPNGVSGFSVLREIANRKKKRSSMNRKVEKFRSRAGPLPAVRSPAIRARSRDPDGLSAANVSEKKTTERQLSKIKEKIMQKNQLQFNGPVKAIIGALALTVLVAFGAPQAAHASTAAGTKLTNTVTVDYKSVGNVSYSDTATVTVTVSLVEAKPTVAFVSQTPVATVASPTDENTAVAQTYSIYSNSNGSEQFTINQAGFTATNIGAATGVTASSTVWLGATALTTKATASATVYVPYDGTNDGEILTNSETTAGRGIVANDYVMIGGTKYQVTAIDETVGNGLAELTWMQR